MVDQYSATKNKAQRSIIVSDIVDTIRRKASGGFVKQEPDGTWVEVGDTLAREKVRFGCFHLVLILFVCTEYAYVYDFVFE
jgi:hypothetical protein